MSTFEAKLTPYLEMKLRLSDEEASKLGRKDTEAYPLCSVACSREHKMLILMSHHANTTLEINAINLRTADL